MTGTAELPGALRALARGVTGAVRAAAAGDGPAFEVAAGQVERGGTQAADRLLASMVRSLVERTHPDGVGGDDLADLAREAAAAVAAWQGPADPLAAAVVLTGAFGIEVTIGTDGAVRSDRAVGSDGLVDTDGPALPGPAAVLRAALVLVARLLAAASGGVAPAGAPLERALAEAFDEIARQDAQDG